MEHRPAEGTDWRAAGDEHFTGRVWFGPVHSARQPGELDVLGVAFEPGARTDWHTHPAGQVLYIVSGTARIQSQGGDRVTASPGDAVVAGPGEVHWHGAAPNSPMVHLSITDGGPTEWLPRKVTDAEYGAAK